MFLILFLMVFAEASKTGAPVGFIAFCFCLAFRLGYLESLTTGVVVWFLLSAAMAIHAITTGFR